MPNWCMNELVVTGNAKDIAKFWAQAEAAKVVGGKHEDTDFCFEPFLPLPRELSTGPCDLKPNPAMIKLTGYSNWYDRNCNVLGTKWDVKGSISIHEKKMLGYTFDSAWAPPTEGVRRISELYPKLHFHLSYDEPGMDFAGVVEIEDGEIIEETQTKSLINQEEE